MDFARADVVGRRWMVPTSPMRRRRPNPPCVGLLVARDECVKDGEGRKLLGYAPRLWAFTQFRLCCGCWLRRLNGGIEVESPSQRRVFPRHLLAIRLSHDIIAHSNQDGIEILVRRFKLPHERTSKR